jgi:hypothetical protein
MKTTVKNKPVGDTQAGTPIASIRKALSAALAAQRTAYGDIRTSGTVCTDHLDAAVKELMSAGYGGLSMSGRKELTRRLNCPP